MNSASSDLCGGRPEHSSAKGPSLPNLFGRGARSLAHLFMEADGPAARSYKRPKVSNSVHNVRRRVRLTSLEITSKAAGSTAR